MSTPTNAAPQAHIADLSYRNYDGPRRAATLGWWTVATMTMRMNVRKVGYWIPTGLIILAAFVLILLFFFSSRFLPESQKATYANTIYQCVCGDWTLLMQMLLGLVVGAGAVASDTQANALLVYFARPLSKLEYVFGKWLGVFLMIFMAGFLPALLIYLYFLAAYTSDGFFKQDPFLLLKTFAASLIAPAIDTSLILGFSAMSRSGRVAGASFAVFYLLLGAITNVLGWTTFRIAVMDDDLDKPIGNRIHQAMTIRRLNVVGITDGIGMRAFRMTPKKNRIRFLPMPPKSQVLPEVWPLATLGVLMIIVPMGLVTWRVRAVEVVSG